MTEKKYALVLFKKNTCPYCQKVLSVLQKMEKDIFLVDINEKNNREKLIDKGGKAQVPCLFINDEPLYESDAIISWLQKHADEF